MSTHTVETLYATGHWLLSRSRPRDAAQVFRAMTLTRPDDERGWLALGACHEAIGQRRIAIELYRIASYAAAPAIRCAIARARALRELEALDDAALAFDEACTLATENGDLELAELAALERDAA